MLWSVYMLWWYRGVRVKNKPMASFPSPVRALGRREKIDVVVHYVVAEDDLALKNAAVLKPKERCRLLLVRLAENCQVEDVPFPYLVKSSKAFPSGIGTNSPEVINYFLLYALAVHHFNDAMDAMGSTSRWASPSVGISPEVGKKLAVSWQYYRYAMEIERPELPLFPSTEYARDAAAPAKPQIRRVCLPAVVLIALCPAGTPSCSRPSR
jgi:hypothetical protein